MQNRVKLINTNESWNEKKRYKINSVVSYLGSIYQNSTGANSDPVLGNDWVVVKKLDVIPVVYQDDFIDSGTHQFEVPEGILIQNAFLNDAQVGRFSQSGTTVTVSNSETNDLVTLTGRN